MDWWVYLIIGVVLFILLLSYIFYRKMFHVSKRRPYFDELYLRKRFLPDQYDEVISWSNSIQYEEVWIESFDHLRLHGRIIPNDSDNIVILVHGYHSNSNRMLELAKMYFKMNYQVLLVDLRAHGLSEGEYVGIGYFDSFDLQNWVKYVSNRYFNCKIVLHGFSMGAASIMNMSNVELPNIECLIADCGFTTMTDELSYKICHDFHLPSFPLVQLAELFYCLTSRKNLFAFNPLKNVADAKYPILFIHGIEDKYVPCYSAVALNTVCTSRHDILLVPGAGHTFSFREAPKTYQQKIEDFIAGK